MPYLAIQGRQGAIVCVPPARLVELSSRTQHTAQPYLRLGFFPAGRSVSSTERLTTEISAKIKSGDLPSLIQRAAETVSLTPHAALVLLAVSWPSEGRANTLRRPQLCSHFCKRVANDS